jgi:hypothetical protein
VHRPTVGPHSSRRIRAVPPFVSSCLPPSPPLLCFPVVALLLLLLPRVPLCRLCRLTAQSTNERGQQASERRREKGPIARGVECAPEGRVPFLAIRLASRASNAAASPLFPASRRSACCPASACRAEQARQSWRVAQRQQGTGGSMCVLPASTVPCRDARFHCALPASVVPPGRTTTRRGACVPACWSLAGGLVCPSAEWNRQCGQRCLGGEASDVCLVSARGACAHMTACACSSEQHSPSPSSAFHLVQRSCRWPRRSPRAFVAARTIPSIGSLAEPGHLFFPPPLLRAPPILPPP